VRGQDDLQAAFQEPLSLRLPDPLPAATSARLEALFLPRPRGRVHRQGQGSRPVRVSRYRSSPPTTARRPASSCCMPSPCPAIHYDGHTLHDAIEGAQRLTGLHIELLTSTRDIVASADPTHAASSSQAKSAACSASSSASSDDDPPSNPSSAT